MQTTDFTGELSPARFSPEEAKVVGFRLELIHFLRTPLHCVHEVLSEVSTPGCIEDFFQQMSEERKKHLFLTQMAKVTQLSGCYTLNLTVSMLEDNAFIAQILEQRYAQKIIIEIQDPGNLLQLNDVEQAAVFDAITRLSAAEYRVWLDDLYPEHLYAWRKSGITFDAVKIDCQLFRQLSDSATVFARTVRRYREAGKMVVVEGVETIADYITCLQSGADALQGYFFRQEWIRLPVH